MNFLYLIFYASLRLRFLDVETNHVPRRPVPDVCRNSAVMCRAWPGTLVTWSRLRLSMICCCALRLWSQICVTCRRYWFPDWVTLSCCTGARCLGPEGWLHTYETVTEHFANPNLSVVVAKCFFLGCMVWDRTFVISLYRNPDLDDWIFDYLPTSMAAVQTEDIRAPFLFVCDLNGHHQEWLGSTTTNRHWVAAFDFATVSGCDQLVVGPTHARGGTKEDIGYRTTTIWNRNNK